MATDTYMFQYLKEKIDKGFPDPLYKDTVNEGSVLYAPRLQAEIFENPDFEKLLEDKSDANCRVAMFFDGPFFPIRNGVCYTINNLMRTLSQNS